MRSRLINLIWAVLLIIFIFLSGCAPTQPSPAPVMPPTVPAAWPTLIRVAKPVRPPTAEPTVTPASSPPPAATPINVPTSTPLPPSPTGPALPIWTQLAFAAQAVHTLTLHPTQEQVIYAGLGPDLQRSTDGGRSWQSLAQELPTPPCAGEGAWQVIVNPARPEELYAYFPGRSPWFSQNCPAVLARSDDGGSHWTPLALPKLPWPWGAMGSGPGELAPQALSIHPHSRTGDLYVWEYLDTDPRSGGVEALLKSADKGQSWEKLPMPPDYGTLPNHRFFGFYGEGDEAVLYGTTQDVYYMDSGMNPVYLYRSADGAAHWEQIALPESPRAYAPLPGTAGFYAAVASYTDWQNGALELYRVKDLEGEKTGWLPRLGHAFPDGILRVDPGDGNVLVWTNRPRESLHEPPIEAIHLSEDGGRTWVPLALPRSLMVNDLAVQRSIAGDYATLYLASDDGLWAYACQRSPLSGSAQATATAGSPVPPPPRPPLRSRS